MLPLLLLLTPPLPAPPPPCQPLSEVPPVPPPSRNFDPSVPYGDELGDAWEMEEVSCWRGVWTRRGRSNLWDAYWIHPRGERARAVLRIRSRGRGVSVTRAHPNGYSCHYTGTISADWWEISGTYRCSWEPETVLPWRAQIIRLERSEPQLLRNPPRRINPPPVGVN